MARLAKKNDSNTFNLKAENNTLTFEEGCFYNITTKDGKEYRPNEQGYITLSDDAIAVSKTIPSPH